MRIAIDLDGVCYNFTASLAGYIEHMTGERLNPVPSCWEFYSRDWGMSLEEYLQWFEEGVNAAWVFAIGQPAEGCIEALEALRVEGHTIHLVTERNLGWRAKQNTAEWLHTWHIPYDTLTFADGNKSELLKVDMAVDDRPRNVIQWRNAGVEAYCFGFDDREDMRDCIWYLPYDWDNFRVKMQERQALEHNYSMEEYDYNDDYDYQYNPWDNVPAWAYTYSPEDFCAPIQIAKDYEPELHRILSAPTALRVGPVGPVSEGEVRVINPNTGGQKGSKLARFDLIPPGPLWKLAEHYGRGAAKYAERNWELGYEINLSFAAAQRHWWSFWNKRELDGSPYEGDDYHLSACAFHTFAAQEFLVTHPEMDNRPATLREAHNDNH
jgi:hypothetical protein